jgi:hypothetical protein
MVVVPPQQPQALPTPTHHSGLPFLGPVNRKKFEGQSRRAAECRRAGVEGRQRRLMSPCARTPHSGSRSAPQVPHDPNSPDRLPPPIAWNEWQCYRAGPLSASGRYRQKSWKFDPDCRGSLQQIWASSDYAFSRAPVRFSRPDFIRNGSPLGSPGSFPPLRVPSCSA